MTINKRWGKEKLDLPKDVTITIKELCEKDYLLDMDDENIENAVSDYLSDSVGFCHFGYKMDIKTDEPMRVDVTDIDWDISE